MPELPEVEIYARYFARHALEQTIAGVRVLDERVVGAGRFSTIRGHAFGRVARHGKHLFAEAVGPRPTATRPPGTAAFYQTRRTASGSTFTSA